MKVRVTARHARFGPEVKQAAEDKAAHLERYFHHLSKMEVVLDHDGEKRNRVEILAHAVRGQVLVSHATHGNVLAALDAAIGKMERTLVRFKEKLSDKHAREASRHLGDAGPPWW
jgi:ribosomal subunit interface protein